MKHYAILFNRKSGRAIKLIEQPFGDAMLKMVALNNTRPSQDCIIFNDNGIITAYIEGNKNDMPTFCEDMIGKSVEEFGFSIKEIM